MRGSVPAEVIRLFISDVFLSTEAETDGNVTSEEERRANVEANGQRDGYTVQYLWLRHVSNREDWGYYHLTDINYNALTK